MWSGAAFLQAFWKSAKVFLCIWVTFSLILSNPGFEAHLILSQVIVHHDHSLLIGDAIPVDSLVGMVSTGRRL